MKEIDPDVQANIMAAIGEGHAITKIAKDFGVAPSTVSSLKRKLLGSAGVEELMADCLTANLIAMQKIVGAASDPKWIKTQTADNVGLLLGIITDKSVRMALALQGLQQSGNRLE